MRTKTFWATLAFVLFLAAWALLGWPLLLMLFACAVVVPLLLGLAVAACESGERHEGR